MGPCGGDKRDRTVDPLLAKQVLSQLSYTPVFPQERAPSKLNNVKLLHKSKRLTLGHYDNIWCYRVLLRKEVIQPLVLERLPCYDFTPIIEPTFGRALYC